MIPAKKTLLDWLAKDDIEQVLQGLFFLADKYKDEELRNAATLQSARYNALKMQRSNNTVSQENDQLQTAKIRQSLLQIIHGLPDDWTLDGMETTTVPTASTSKVNWKKYATYFATAIALLAGIAEFSGYSLRDLFTKDAPVETPAEMQSSTPNVSTTGDQSPAIITNDGDVNISYGDTDPKKDSTRTTPNPKK